MLSDPQMWTCIFCTCCRGQLVQLRHRRVNSILLGQALSTHNRQTRFQVVSMETFRHICQGPLQWDSQHCKHNNRWDRKKIWYSLKEQGSQSASITWKPGTASLVLHASTITLKTGPPRHQPVDSVQWASHCVLWVLSLLLLLATYDGPNIHSCNVRILECVHMRWFAFLVS